MVNSNYERICSFNNINGNFSCLSAICLGTEAIPAGGGWLTLNGIDSFAVCEDNNSLDKNLNDFTIEAWIYPKRKPERDEWWIIAAKPGSYELAFIGPNDRLYSQSVKDFGIFSEYTPTSRDGLLS